jgi:hypothetical protein
MLEDFDRRLAQLEDRFRELEVMYRDLLLALSDASEGRWVKADLILKHLPSAPSTEAGPAGRGASPEARPPMPTVEGGAETIPVSGKGMHRYEDAGGE